MSAVIVNRSLSMIRTKYIILLVIILTYKQYQLEACPFDFEVNSRIEQIKNSNSQCRCDLKHMENRTRRLFFYVYPFD